MLNPMAMTYVDSIAAAFDRVVTERVPALREPRAGYAVGVIAGELVRGARAWLGDELAAEIRVVTVPRGAACLEPVTPRRFLADAEARPLVDELGVRLQARLRLAVADARATVTSAIALVPDARVPT